MNMSQKRMIVIYAVIMICSPVVIFTQSEHQRIIDLPTPLILEMSIDEIIQRRTSVREFTQTPLTLKDISTVLYNAYGIRSDRSHTIPYFKNEYAVQIYLLMDDGIYLYDPEGHRLVFYSSDDARYIGQYNAPIQLAICWDTTKNTNELIAGMQIGAVGQNIYHTCIAMGLGTVTTAEVPSPLDSIGLPNHIYGKIVMPIGHPTMETKYLFLPMLISPLPKVLDSQVSLTSTIKEWNITESFTHDSLSKQDISQFLWACYGYSYYLDHSGFEMHFIERHRAVPSAHGYYPLEIFTVTSNGMYWYIPGIRNNDPFGLPIVTFLWKRMSNDIRSSLAEVTDSIVEDAPISFIITLNIRDTIDWDDLSDPALRWVWTYEVGACVQNLLLDTNAWDFTIKIVPIEKSDYVNQILRLNENYDPFVIISIG
jgi:nitroreductase